MKTTEAPDLTPGYPSKGPRLGPVWKDVWAELCARPRVWQDAWAIADVMAGKYDLAPLSIVQLMSRMAAGKVLEREKRPVTTTITRTQNGTATTREGLRSRSHYRINPNHETEHAAWLETQPKRRSSWRADRAAVKS